MSFNRRIGLPVLLVLVSTLPVSADEVKEPVDSEPDPGRLFSTREEQREAGRERELVPGLLFSGLLELELTRDRSNTGTEIERDDEGEAVVQLGLKALPADYLTAELLTEYDSTTGKLKLEEATVEFDAEPWEFTIGKQYLPFGVFYSHFVSSPMIELGETRANAGAVSYNFDDRLDLSLSVYDGRARQQDVKDHGIDWALSAETWLDEHLSFGFSYLTDLADSDERLLEEHEDLFLNKVPALGVFGAWSADRFQISLEVLGASRTFNELDEEYNQPRAWNLEYAHFPQAKYDWALRLEGSRELEEAPWLRYGVAANFRIHQYATFSMEMLHSRFDSTRVLEEDSPYKHATRIGAMLVVAF